MKPFLKGLFDRRAKNWKSTALTVSLVVIVLLVVAFFSIPKVLMSSNTAGLYRDEKGYDMPAAAPAESGYLANGREVVGGAGGNMAMDQISPARAKQAQMEEYEQKADVLSSTSALDKDGNKSIRADIMSPAYAAEVFKPQIIKTANLTLEVENIVASIKLIENLTTAHGGLITNKNVSIAGEHNEYRSGNIQVRVPQPRLDKFLADLDALGIPRQETVSSEDVGAEVVDLESRIRNSKAQESVLLGIMQRSGKIPDVLQVAQELARVRQEVEQMQGRLNYLRQQVAYSTVNIQLTEKTLTSPTQGKPSFIDVIGNSAKDAFGKLIDFINVLLAGIVGFVILWVPILFVVFLISKLLWKFILKRPLCTLKDKCFGDGQSDNK